MGGISQPETDQKSPRFAVRPALEARTVLISMNPRWCRHRHEQVSAICRALERDGYEVRMTADLNALRGLAIDGLASGQLRAVIAIGGDGTASVVRNHVPFEVPLLPAPMGTENLLGRYLGQLATPQAVCRTLADGVTVALDLGRAGEKVFLLMISVGFDAEVIRSLHENRRGNIRRTAYCLPIFARYAVTPIRPCSYIATPMPAWHPRHRCAAGCLALICRSTR